RVPVGAYYVLGGAERVEHDAVVADGRCGGYFGVTGSGGECERGVGRQDCAEGRVDALCHSPECKIEAGQFAYPPGDLPPNLLSHPDAESYARFGHLERTTPCSSPK